MYRTLLVGVLRTADMAFKIVFPKRTYLYAAFLPWQWGVQADFRPIYGAVRVFFGRKMIAEQKLFIFAGEYSS